MDHHDPHESFAERQTRLEQLFHLVGYQPETEVDDEILAERSRRWSSRAIAVAGLFLLVFNTHALKSWAASLPPDWTGVTLRVLSDAWSQRLAELGLERPRAVLHETYTWPKGLTWTGAYRAPVDPEAPPPPGPPASPSR